MYASGANSSRYVHNMAPEPMLEHVVRPSRRPPPFADTCCRPFAAEMPKTHRESRTWKVKSLSTNCPQRLARPPPPEISTHPLPAPGSESVPPALIPAAVRTLLFFSFTFSCYYCQFQQLWHRLIDEASVQLCGRRTQSSRTCLAAIKQISSRGCSSCAAHNMPLFRSAACVQTDGPLHQGQKVKHSSSCQERAYYYDIFPIRRPRAHSATNMLKVIPDLHYHFPRA